MNDEPLNKYDTAELTDPLVRCYHCTKLVSIQYISKHGGCNHCGNRRFNYIRGITTEEKVALQQREYDLGVDYDIDPEYLDIFQPVPE